MPREVAGAFAGPWLWLFPFTYLIHAVEEVWAGEGYAAWISRISGQPLTTPSLVVLHAVLIAAMAVTVAVVQKRERFLWTVVGFAVIFAGNGLLHGIMSLLTSSYSPGLLTGLLIWVPLGLAALLRAGRRLPRRDLGWGVVIGVLGSVLISVLALHPALIPLP